MHESRLRAPGYVLAAAFSVQFGAAIAKSLFDDVGPPGVLLFRLLFGALAVAALLRPRIADRSRDDIRLALAFGLVLFCMNLSFYEALDRVPLGIAVTIEFVGPLGVAIAGSRRAIDVLWVVLAGAGIGLLAEARGSVEPFGLALAALAGIFWAGYIVLGTRVGRAWPGSGPLLVALALGSVLALPLGIASGGGDLFDPRVVVGGIGVGLLSSALPYSLELASMRRLPTHVFGVLLSLEPAVAAFVGFVALGEHLRPRALLAIALVVVASAGAALGAREPALPLDA
jgi:inner membrane transporter RhtA